MTTMAVANASIEHTNVSFEAEQAVAVLEAYRHPARTLGNHLPGSERQTCEMFQPGNQLASFSGYADSQVAHGGTGSQAVQ